MFQVNSIKVTNTNMFGIKSEIGMDLNNIHAKKVAVYTDSTVSLKITYIFFDFQTTNFFSHGPPTLLFFNQIAKLHPLKAVIESLDKHKVNYIVYDTCRVEPTDTSFKSAIEFARNHNPDAFVAVGGGSVIDTAKAASLYSAHPEADFLDFVNAPIGKGLPIRKKLHPLIAGKYNDKI